MCFVKYKGAFFVIEDKSKKILELEKKISELEEKIFKLEKLLNIKIQKFNYPENWFNLENLPGEIWKDIEGYEGLYQISSKGRVKSFVFGRQKILKTNARNDYRNVALHKNGKSKTFGVHVLVARAFIPNPENLPIPNHEDGNKFNNCVENLKWVNQSDNARHACKNNLQKILRGAENGGAKLNNEDIYFIRKNHERCGGKFSTTELMKKFNVSRNTINRVVRNATYK